MLGEDDFLLYTALGVDDFLLDIALGGDVYLASDDTFVFVLGVVNALGIIRMGVIVEISDLKDGWELKGPFILFVVNKVGTLLLDDVVAVMVEMAVDFSIRGDSFET